MSGQRMNAILGFGSAANGSLGIKTESKEDEIMLQPKRISFFDSLAPICDVCCGSQHTLFLLENGTIYSCGNNNCSQLGRESLEEDSYQPGLVKTLADKQVVEIACGERHNLALSVDGYVYSWGSSDLGQLGLEKGVSGCRPAVVNLTEVVQISCGSNHSLALCADGRLLGWGCNSNGQLGIGSGENVPRPRYIQSLSGVTIRRISCGSIFSCALSISGAFFSWGANLHGQLGCGDTNDRHYPVHVKTLRYLRVIDIACGDSHTTVLTAVGGIFTFGADTYGQLGHGKKIDEPTPRQVVELMGSEVLRIACGRYHTLALVNNKVYSFGSGANGQLGTGSARSYVTPSQIGKLDGIDAVFAGDDRSIVRVARSDKALKSVVPSYCASSSVPKHVTYNKIKELLEVNDKYKINRLCETVFSSPSCVNGSFLVDGTGHFGANKSNHGIDLDSVMETFDLLSESAQCSDVIQSIQRAMEWSLLPELHKIPPPDIETLRLFLILPCFPGFSDNLTSYDTLHLPFAASILMLTKVPLTVLEFWWESVHTRHFGRLVRIYRRLISHILLLPEIYDNQTNAQANRLGRERALQVSLELLAKLNAINAKCQKVPFDMFYVHELVDKVDIRQDYVRWLLAKGEKRLSYCDYPFVFDAAGKTMLLQTDAQVQMQMLVEEANRHNMAAMFIPFLQPQVSPFLVLVVNRDRIVDDAVVQLLNQRSDGLKKPLKVQFVGEEADDAGGVKKEFFMLLFEELLHEKYGMFVENGESRELWFSGFDWVETGMYQVVGILCGLAIYNAVLVDFHFPLALYKKLLHQTVNLEDFKTLSPTEGNSLEQLLDYDGEDVEQMFSLAFEIDVTMLDFTHSVELKPDGKNILVSQENKHEYVDLYVDFKLNKAVQQQFDAFADGFYRAINSKLVHFFQPQELREMVAGNEQYDWNIFKQNTEYKGEFWANHPTIRIFWDVFGELTLPNKKKFLQFLTGSDRIPLLGMNQIKMVIQPSSAEYMPVAHTCFNLLDLPKLTDRDLMEKKLLEAIQYTRGFSLV